VVNATHQPLYFWGRPCIAQVAWWASGPFGTGIEILAPTGVQTADHLAKYKSL